MLFGPFSRRQDRSSARVPRKCERLANYARTAKLALTANPDQSEQFPGSLRCPTACSAHNPACRMSSGGSGGSRAPPPKQQEADQDELLRQASQLLEQYVLGASRDAREPLVALASPGQIAAAFDAAGVPLALADDEPAASTDALVGVWHMAHMPARMHACMHARDARTHGRRCGNAPLAACCCRHRRCCCCCTRT